MTAISKELLERIRNENLNVYRASAQRLREDVGQESQIAQDYRGRLIYELLQNADDAMSSVDSNNITIEFALYDGELWVANSGRPLDEADVRGLCGISASSKHQTGSRRASIGHKGMGFKSVLEITDAPEAYSTTIAFRFGPAEAVRAVQELTREGVIETVKRAPVTRFPWPVDDEPSRWQELRASGMNTAFRFPLLRDKNGAKRIGLAAALRNLPITSLVFLKHLARIKIRIHDSESTQSFAWTVKRARITESENQPVTEFSEAGTYRVELKPDQGEADTFVVAYNPQIEIAGHRGGLDEVSWDGVTITEASVAARVRDDRPIALEPHWRKFHVFLPTGEPCPYDLLVSGAFNSNLSRQEIRVEADGSNYNSFLLGQVARTLRDDLIPALTRLGASAENVLLMLDRRTAVNSPTSNRAADVLYEEVRRALGDFPFVPAEEGDKFPIPVCAVPPLVSDSGLGPAFRKVLSSRASVGDHSFPAAEFCRSDIARVLVDHGAYCLSPEEATAALAQSDPARSKLEIHASTKYFVDPVLCVLESLWAGLPASDQFRLAEAVRNQPIFPVAMAKGDVACRIPIADLTCFYPPRSLHGEVPLEKLCFLMQEICWGTLTPKERNLELKQQLAAWQGLFDVQEFKFPAVMRASVLPALDLERDNETKSERQALHSLERIAAICQLAGRTCNPEAPLPYERLGPNRAISNLSRLDLPCRSETLERVEWVPAYKVYFGEDWIGDKAVERILKSARETGISDPPGIHFLVSPSAFDGLLTRYRHLNDPGEVEDVDVATDEVSVDEDEESAIELDDKDRWRRFLQWLGVNQVLRPVHFHDVEDRASGWLTTRRLSQPEGWIFKAIPAAVWKAYVDEVRRLFEEELGSPGIVPYFYQLHDLEYLVALLNIASRDTSTQIGKALFEHLARNWIVLERFLHAEMALVPENRVPSMRTKPPRALPDELLEFPANFWLARLRLSPFCPTTHGPRRAGEVWLPTPEVERRFGQRGRTGSELIPTLEVDTALVRGKSRGFAQALEIRDELTPTNFSLRDARLLLERLRDLYSSAFENGKDVRQLLREVIRPAYRNLFELLQGAERSTPGLPPHEHSLDDAPLLATDGNGNFRFLDAKTVFYVERNDTRDRMAAKQLIWTFILEALPVARPALVNLFHVRVLEDSLNWHLEAGECALDPNSLRDLQTHLDLLAPYILARISMDRSVERLVREDARKLRSLFERLEPVDSLKLSCELDGRTVELDAFARDSFVRSGGGGVPSEVFIVWGENAWPPDDREAEGLVNALCEVFGSAYYEPFLALVRAKTADERLRILRRAGAPRDIDEQIIVYRAGDLEHEENAASGEGHSGYRTAPSLAPTEQPAVFPGDAGPRSSEEGSSRVQLYSLEQLLLDGVPVLVLGGNGSESRSMHGQASGKSNEHSNNGSSSGYGGRTDLTLLNQIGMSVTLAYERNRLRRSGLANAEVFDETLEGTQADALVFDVSSPGRIAAARKASAVFDTAMKALVTDCQLSPEWPGFDVLTLDPNLYNYIDRIIELKSSGVASRSQDMTWNEWKSARSSTLKERFYLYLVGNLRSDLNGSKPFIRAIRNPFEQLIAEAQVNRKISRSVHLDVYNFQEAEHLELSIRPAVRVSEDETELARPQT